MVKWKNVILFYILLLFLLFLTTSYQVSSIIVKKHHYEDRKIVFGEYLFTDQKDKKVLQGKNYSYVEVGKRIYRWTVTFKLDKSPKNYKFESLIDFKAYSTYAYTEGNETVQDGGCMFSFSLYANGERVDEAEQCHGISFGTNRWGKCPLSIERSSYYYLRKGLNNLTAIVVCWWWYLPPNVNISGGYANYTLGPFEVTVGELKTVFGLQPDYLVPGLILILPVSVALEIVTRRVRKKLRRIERVKQ